MSEYDINADGFIDTVSVDSYGDGVADMVGTDIDQNGVVDIWSVDANNDSVIDTYAYDTNQNGMMDAVVTDGNQDGYSDQVILDTNENQVNDALETAPTSTGAEVIYDSSGTPVSGPGVIGPATNPDPQVTLQETLAAHSGSATFGSPDYDHDGYVDSRDYRPTDPTRY